MELVALTYTLGDLGTGKGGGSTRKGMDVINNDTHLCDFQIMARVTVPFFIGPESDHCLFLLVTHSLTH